MSSSNEMENSLKQQENNEIQEQMERIFQVGKVLAHPPSGEEVVITGMAGRFPESDDVYKYRDNILNKKDMVSNDNRRWKPTHPEIPHRSGKISFLEKLDAGFFGVCSQQAHQMDPQCRQAIEKAFEAILDAGLHPDELKGSKTGVFIGSCYSETERDWLYKKLQSPSYGIFGCLRSMQANWISYVLGLEGPSMLLDTACSSSLTALDYAYRAIRTGRCDSALVGGTNLCLLPNVTLQFARLGVLSLDGVCKSFDEDAIGYARSETAAVIFLQKSKDARRIYAQVVHAKTNSDGYKAQSITFPSGAAQKQLLEETYQECNVDPALVDFLEAHATGTKVGDPEEIRAMNEVFCVNRRKPLLVGSIKSNLGHTEPAAGMCSIVKVVLGMENDCILPNINFSRPRKGVEALEKNKMKVVTETTSWPKDGSGYVAINSFGFGGSNCHVLLKRFIKKKVCGGEPKDDLPRLVCVSGRTKESIASVLNDISKRPLDAEFVRIFHEIFKKDIARHLFRGFILMSKTGERKKSLEWFNGEKAPLCLTLSGPNEKWLNVSKELLAIPLFAATIQRICNILSPLGVNVSTIINEVSDDAVSVIIATVATQIALVDILKALGLRPSYIIGHSTGELVAAYADGALTLEQAVLAALSVGGKLQKINTSRKTEICCRISLNKSEVRFLLPSDVEIVSYDSERSFTISGPSQKITQFVSNLKDKGVIVEEISGYYGLHSKHLAQIYQELLQSFKEIIPKPKERSLRWVSTFGNRERLTGEALQYASAQYFASSLLNPIILKGIATKVPPKPVLLEVGRQFVNVEDSRSVNLVFSSDGDSSIHSLLCGLGSLYELGYNVELDQLYPKVQWPVSNNTPMVSPLIKWNYSEDWAVALHEVEEQTQFGERLVSISIKYIEWRFLSGHVIDDRNLVPATAYLFIVWETLAMMLGVLTTDIQVVFENVKYKKAVTISKHDLTDLLVMIKKGTGSFEVRKDGETAVSGKVYVPKDISQETVAIPTPVVDESPLSFTTKDIYKELKLRGYNYMGYFCGISDCDVSAQKASIEWNGNWVAFMDCMLQLKILQEDTRSLYVPIGIDRLVIDPRYHVKLVTELGENPVLPVYADRKIDIIKSGGIEIRGLLASSISRRPPRGEPVLEAYKFMPFEAELSLEQAIRVHTQIMLENNFSINFRAVELVDEATAEGATPLGPVIHSALSDQPLIQPDVVVLSQEPLELTNVTVEQRLLLSENHTCSLVVLSDVVNRPEVKDQVVNALKENGCIISREGLDFDVAVVEKSLPDLHVVAAYQTKNEKLVLLRKLTKFTTSTVVDISDSLNFGWLPAVKNIIQNNEKAIIVAQNAPLNGILGFINCLKREPGSTNVKCVFIIDSAAPSFDVNNDLYSKQLEKGLTVNILKDGEWGTYRHLLLEKEASVQCEHIYNNVLVRGDLSSLRWLEGPLTSHSVLPLERTLVHIYCTSLNFRDVMTASGRISVDAITRNRSEQLILEGLEFSGRDSSGRRVMGMLNGGALATMIDADSYLTWEIPEHFSMKEAATLPVAYCTVLVSLLEVADMKKGQSILIHSGSGAVGQAAINVALYHNCEIFTTVGTQEKRDFIRKTYPKIPESRIGNSRDTSFEQMIFKETNGRGVDIVLNSLAEEKLQASVRCLAPCGKFIEIGKFDMANNSPVGLKSFADTRSFHGIALDVYFWISISCKRKLNQRFIEGLASGMIKPLNRTVFNEDEVENAFRYMASGKHTGKIVINLREEEPEKNIVPKFRLFAGLPQFYGNSDRSYIICGGLGGFGLELADWLVIRKVQKLVLVSRFGLKTGYQTSRLRIWKSYGVTVEILTEDITKAEGCAAVVKQANDLGPVEGIFNLAVILKDALFENQNKENFMASLAPKATATKHLDTVSREMCPELRYFVVFSSVVCGRGNVGQTNYGMANSIMERICEQRKKDGYPALAIQWGAIGEVGLVAEMQELQTEIEIGGTLQQRITSCLEVMDRLLKQDEPIVSSIVVAEKKQGGGGTDSITAAVKNVLGIRDLKTISRHAPLSELGMDSMMAVEIKQTLEREYEVFLSARDIRTMTFARLQEIADEKTLSNESQTTKNNKNEKLPQGLALFLRYTGGEEKASVPMVRLSSLIEEKSVAHKVFLLPGIDGMANIMEPLAANLAAHAFCLQFTYSDQPESTIEEIAKTLFLRVQENLPQNTPFTLVAYSYGCIIGLELAALLEADRRIGRVILIDGSPAMFQKLVKEQLPETGYEPLLQTLTLCVLMQLFLPLETVLKHKNDILNCETFEQRVKMVLNSLPEGIPYSEEYRRQACLTAYHRIRSGFLYQPTFQKLKSVVKLFKPSQPTVENFDEDYKLQELCEIPVEMSTFEGHHWSILKNPQVAYAISAIFDTSNTYLEQTVIKDMAEKESARKIIAKP